MPPPRPARRSGAKRSARARGRDRETGTLALAGMPVHVDAGRPAVEKQRGDRVRYAAPQNVHRMPRRERAVELACRAPAALTEKETCATGGTARRSVRQGRRSRDQAQIVRAWRRTLKVLVPRTPPDSRPQPTCHRVEKPAAFPMRRAGSRAPPGSASVKVKAHARFGQAASRCHHIGDGLHLGRSLAQEFQPALRAWREQVAQLHHGARATGRRAKPRRFPPAVSHSRAHSRPRMPAGDPEPSPRPRSEGSASPRKPKLWMLNRRCRRSWRSPCAERTSAQRQILRSPCRSIVRKRGSADLPAIRSPRQHPGAPRRARFPPVP